jgi:hypothetical protein
MDVNSAEPCFLVAEWVVWDGCWRVQREYHCRYRILVPIPKDAPEGFDPGPPADQKHA